MKSSRYGYRRGSWLATATAALFAAGCATAPKAIVDTADEPWACETFAWLEADRAVSIAEQRVRNEVAARLEDKGYRKVEASADCLVAGEIFTGTRAQSPVSVGIGAGRWGGNVGGSVGVSMPVGGPRTIGNLAIDVVDAARKAEVWRGTLEGAFRKADPGADEVAAAVTRLMEEFPARDAR
jgi:hypothetical protein